MKSKIIVLIALTLCLAVSAAAQKKTKPADKMADSIVKLLTDKEQTAWKNLVDKKYDDFAKMFAEDYQGVYDTETTTKASEVAEVKQMTFKTAEVTDIKVKMLDASTALVTSMVKSDMIAPDGKEYNEPMRATTIYVKRGKQWLIVYHAHVVVRTM